MTRQVQNERLNSIYFFNPPEYLLKGLELRGYVSVPAFSGHLHGVFLAYTHMVLIWGHSLDVAHTIKTTLMLEMSAMFVTY